MSAFTLTVNDGSKTLTTIQNIQRESRAREASIDNEISKVAERLKKQAKRVAEEAIFSDNNSERSALVARNTFLFEEDLREIDTVSQRLDRESCNWLQRIASSKGRIKEKENYKNELRKLCVADRELIEQHKRRFSSDCETLLVKQYPLETLRQQLAELNERLVVMETRDGGYAGVQEQTESVFNEVEQQNQLLATVRSQYVKVLQGNDQMQQEVETLKKRNAALLLRLEKQITAAEENEQMQRLEIEQLQNTLKEHDVTSSYFTS